MHKANDPLVPFVLSTPGCRTDARYSSGAVCQGQFASVLVLITAPDLDSGALIVGKTDSPALEAVTRQIDLAAPTDAVLVLGESGTGKELVAREVHRRSERAPRPLVKVSRAAAPRERYESEFFGHARGAFTGALRD
jgi:transcriptional regulator with PAS, ATPase and Fis domain